MFWDWVYLGVGLFVLALYYILFWENPGSSKW